MNNVTIKSYLPQEKRERSKLQQLKDKHRSFTQTNKKDIPKDLNELKLIKNRDHAITFLNEYMNIDKKTSKSKYCKTNHISHNTLNTSLKQLGYSTKNSRYTFGKTRVNETKLDYIKPVETKLDQLRPKRKKQNLVKEIKAGKQEYEDEELEEMINNSLSNLTTS